MKHNWAQIFDIIKEVGPGIMGWGPLADAIAARTGSMPRTSLLTGLKRELGRSFVDVSELVTYLRKDDKDLLSPLASAILELVRGRGRDTTFSLLDLSDRFDRAPSSVLSAAEELHKAGYNIVIAKEKKSVTMPRILAPSFMKHAHSP